MDQWITDIIGAVGYWGVAFLMFLENVFPPIPSEIIMPVAGFGASRGTLTLWGAIVAGTVGSVLGQFPLYWVGKKVGEERLRKWADRSGKWLLISGDDIDRASNWFERHGAGAIFFCRLVPGIRSWISVPAGVHKVSLVSFTLYSTAGIALWSTLLAVVGYFLGSNYDRVKEYLGPASWVVGIVIGAAVLFWLGRRAWRTLRHDDSVGSPTPEPEN